MKKIMSLCVFVLFLIGAGLVSASEREDSKEQIQFVLNHFHKAAEQGDEARYLGFLTDQAVFLGTDDWERWPVETFKTYVNRRFKQGKNWSYKPVQRHIALAESGQIAWFDEIIVSEKWGRFRGTGVLEKRKGHWKIAHYSMSFLIPNKIWKEVSDLAKTDYEKRDRQKK